MTNIEASETQGRQGGLARELTMRDGVAVVVGSVIGSGIFLVPGQIALHLRTLSAVILVWIGGGLLTLFGALSLAELGGMFPAAGGLYSYLRETYGRPVGFLYGWMVLTVIQTGGIATLATGLALYLSLVLPLTHTEQKATAIASILLFTGLNLMSLHHAKHIQNISTAAKLLGIAALAALLFSRGHMNLLMARSTVVSPITFLGIGAAITAVLWAYDGWHVVSFTAAEFRNPIRDLPRSLISGTVLVASVYVLINLAYYSVLRPVQIAGSASTAAAAMTAVYGVAMTGLVSLVIVVSMLGAINGLVLTGPRVYYAMARDGLFFRSLGRTNQTTHVPVTALIVQGIWASVLTLTGGFEQLFSMFIFTSWIFYGLCVAAVLILRRAQPHRARPFRTPGAPWIPLLFILSAAGIVISSFVNNWEHALLALAFLLIGVPVYLIFERINRAAR